MNSEKIRLKNFYEQVGEKYPEEEIIYQTLNGRLRKKFVLSQIQSFSGSLIEIGCNQGMYVNEYKNGNAVGADLSVSVLKSGRKRYRDLLCFSSDAENLGAHDDSFDNVLCSEVLEHCLNPEQVLNEIFRILKPAGKALITTPNYRKNRPEWIDLGVLKDFGVQDEEELGYFHTAFRPNDLEFLASRTGFRIIESGTFEKEIKYASKIPVLFLWTVRLLNRLIKSSSLERWNERFVKTFTIKMYSFFSITGLKFLFMPFVKEGVRTFIIIEK